MGVQQWLCQDLDSPSIYTLRILRAVLYICSGVLEGKVRHNCHTYAKEAHLDVVASERWSYKRRKNEAFKNPEIFALSSLTGQTSQRLDFFIYNYNKRRERKRNESSFNWNIGTLLHQTPSLSLYHGRRVLNRWKPYYRGSTSVFWFSTCPSRISENSLSSDGQLYLEKPKAVSIWLFGMSHCLECIWYYSVLISTYKLSSWEYWPSVFNDISKAEFE